MSEYQQRTIDESGVPSKKIYLDKECKSIEKYGALFSIYEDDSSIKLIKRPKKENTISVNLVKTLKRGNNKQD